MINVAIIIGSTRPGRRGEAVGRWVHQRFERHPAVIGGKARTALLDLGTFGLPLLDEPVPALFGEVSHEHTRRWAAAIRGFDAFAFVTPEYNHSLPGALKNAIDYLFAEWNDKAAVAIGYGAQGGVRAVEHLRAVLAEVKVATVRTQIGLSVHDDFRIEDPRQPGELTPRPHQEAALDEAFDELIEWAGAFAKLRAERAA